jgi:hypothetical protein
MSNWVQFLIAIQMGFVGGSGFSGLYACDGTSGPEQEARA